MKRDATISRDLTEFGFLEGKTDMPYDKPEVEPFERAIQRLEEGLARYRADTSDTQIRDGLIQRFEFTYELGHKVLKRYLEYASANPEQFDEMTFQNLIRTGNEQGPVAGRLAELARLARYAHKNQSHL